MNRVQLQAMLWLRWRLTMNQWRRDDGVSAAISIILSVIGIGLAAAGALAGLALGALWLAQASPTTMRTVWDVLVLLFLLLWAIGIVAELQRSEIIDLGRLLHLPVSLRGVFLLNYVASHLSFSLLAIAPAMLGLAFGLMLRRGVAMALLFPLVVAFFFMVTAWTYCLRGWLATLMMNKRRRRAIIMGVTMAFVLLAQLPNLVSNVWFRGSRGRSRGEGREAIIEAAFETSHRFVPFLWLPQGARALGEGQPLPAVWGSLGMFALGAWGLARAYRTTVRFYKGGESSQSLKPASATTPPAPPPLSARPAGANRTIMVERALPAIPEEAAALAFATLRSMIRAPEIKMALASNVLIIVILGASLLVRQLGKLPDFAQPFMASLAIAMAFMGLVQVMFNHFGFDRAGFRALVLLPVPRRLVLLGKNLALLPVALVVSAIYLALAAAFAHLNLVSLLAAVFEFACAFLVLSVAGNLISVLCPYRIAAGTLKPTKARLTTQLVLFVTHLLFPVAMLPIFIPAGLGLLGAHLGWVPGPAITLLSAVLLAVLAGVLYRATLAPLGRLLQRREQSILQIVTQEVE